MTLKSPGLCARSITHVKAVGVALPSFRCWPTCKGGRKLEYIPDAPLPPLPDVQPNGLDTAVFIADLDSDDEDLEDAIWD